VRPAVLIWLCGSWESEMSETTVMTVRLPKELHKAAAVRMIDDGLKWQTLLEAAVQAYVEGNWKPEGGRP
jgi:predicted DNA binding CopG/RHH family protein